LVLRLLNPAILLPEAYGVSAVPPSAAARRQLLLVTKVLQNLANNIRFGNKEQHMAPMNAFLDQNQESFNQFLLDLGTQDVQGGKVTTHIQQQEEEKYKTTVDGDCEGPLTVPEDIYLAHCTFLAVHVTANKPMITEKLREMAPTPQLASAAEETINNILNTLPHSI